MREWRVGKAEEVDPTRPVEAEIVMHPPSATLEEFGRTERSRILVSVAYCMKSPSCPAYGGAECDVECRGCELSEIKRVCADKSVTFRIEVDNDRLMDFLDRESGRFDWVVGVACPYEISRLSPLFWEKYRLRQLILPLSNRICATVRDGGAGSSEAPDPHAQPKIGRLIELLNDL